MDPDGGCVSCNERAVRSGLADRYIIADADHEFGVDGMIKAFAREVRLRVVVGMLV